MKLLIVEDESRIASFVERGLTSAGFSVEVATDGPTGLAAALDVDIDLVVLDVMLPGMRGDEVLRRLRLQRPDVPVIMLTARDGIDDRVAGLNAGADDYVTKPFSFAELLARVQARLRGTEQPSPTKIEIGDIRLDLARRVASVGDREVELTTREFALLELLMRNPDHVLSQTQIIDRVWGYSHAGSSNVVEVYVGYLRRKIGKSAIETVRGAGYRFVKR